MISKEGNLLQSKDRRQYGLVEKKMQLKQFFDIFLHAISQLVKVLHKRFFKIKGGRKGKVGLISQLVYHVSK